jgi:hypothetical protein
MSNDLRNLIIQTANALGVEPAVVATAMSYETGGTFNPMQAGPTTQHGQHRGLIQFGEPQARQFGVDFSSPQAALNSQLGPDGAVVKYLQNAGVKPGMGLMDVYSAINAGHVGLNNRSDANNGGAPGTVADKVNNQMAGHRQNAMKLLGDMSAGMASPSPAPPPVADGPKGQEVYPVPQPSPSPVSPQAIPASVTAAAQTPAANPMAALFGSLGAQDTGPQFSPVQIQGPSQDQSMALANFIKTLMGRAA